MGSNQFILILFLLNTSLVLSYNKKAVSPEVRTPDIFVEDFRKSGMSDQLVIEEAVAAVPEGAILIFADKVYMISHTVYIKKSLTLKGPATLLRENQISYQLMNEPDPESRQVQLNNTDGLRVNDWIIITNGKVDSKSTTSRNLITSIDGNIVTFFYPVGLLLDGSTRVFQGNLLLKDIRFFQVAGETPGQLPIHNCSFEDITFDGNRDNNLNTFSWLLNYSIMASGKGKTVIKKCKFINSPGESIVGHNLYVSDCTFMDLNGSAIHTAIDRLQVAEEDIHSEFLNNRFENTNEVPTKIGGHSEGCITHSNSGGYYIAKYNTFINVGEAVIGLLYPSVSQNDWGTSNILFTENEINTTGRLVYSIGILPGKLINVRIMGNAIFNLNPWSWEKALAHYPDIIIENEVNQPDNP